MALLARVGRERTLCEVRFVADYALTSRSLTGAVTSAEQEEIGHIWLLAYELGKQQSALSAMVFKSSPIISNCVVIFSAQVSFAIIWSITVQRTSAVPANVNFK